jgi:fluoride exporter
MNQIILIFFGAGIGGVLRFLFGKFALNTFGDAYPYGTFGVNIIGGLFIGLAAGILAKYSQHQHFVQYFVIVGILGGFTTFSSFSLDVVRMIEHQRFLEALAYIVASVTISIGAVLLGMVICQKFV